MNVALFKILNEMKQISFPNPDKIWWLKLTNLSFPKPNQVVFVPNPYQIPTNILNLHSISKLCSSYVVWYCVV